MLDIIIPKSERYDEKRGEFIYTKEQKLCLEHSLISLSKWESKYEKPFLSTKKTALETLDYIRFMTLTQNVSPEVYFNLSKENVEAIQAYIEAPMTATTVPKSKKKNPYKETITAELIYYWMIALNIPFECQKWHLNRLLKLIEVCSYKSEPPRKMSRNEILQRNRKLNAERRARLNTKG
jgi:hypothetical protein